MAETEGNKFIFLSLQYLGFEVWTLWIKCQEGKFYTPQFSFSISLSFFHFLSLSLSFSLTISFYLNQVFYTYIFWVKSSRSIESNVKKDTNHNWNA